MKLFPLTVASVLGTKQTLAGVLSSVNVNSVKDIRYPVVAPGIAPSNATAGSWKIPSRRTVDAEFATPPDLAPGEFSVFVNEDEEVVTPNAFRVGLPEGLADSIREFVEERGLGDYLRELFWDESRQLDFEDEEEVELLVTQNRWLSQRFQESWNSNVHWLTPIDEDANQEILHVLSEGGLDDLLQAFGDEFEHLDQLLIYQVTLMAVSYCEDGLIYYEAPDTGNRAFQLIIPLENVEGSPPELEIYEQVSPEEPEELGEASMYNYEDNIGVVMGDYANHRCGDLDYTETGEFRMAAMIYLVDATEDNAQDILDNMYPVDYPPREVNFLLENAGKHWRRGDNVPKSKYQAKPAAKPLDMVPLALPVLKPGELEPIRSQETEEVMAAHAYRLGLPDGLAKALRNYADKVGITAKFRALTGDSPIQNDDEEYFELNTGHQWLAQRPGKHWSSNMHWMSPANEETHNELMKTLGDIGYDQVLESLGDNFDHLGKLRVYQITFIAVTHCNNTNMHHDMTSTDARSINTIIPLMTAEDSPPEFLVKHDDKAIMGGVKYDSNHAVVLSDDAMHATAGVDYRGTSGMRMAATIYSGDIGPEVADGFLGSYTQIFPPKEDKEYLLNEPSIHWQRNGGARLPRHDTPVALPQ